MSTPLRILIRLRWVPLAFLVGGTAFAADTEADFRTAYARAAASQQEAGRLRNQWLATESVLADARKAGDRGDFDQATRFAKEAEALAKASIFQATAEKDVWKNLEIR